MNLRATDFLADANGRVAMQIRDLDQTVIGNPAHDLIRLGLSLACAARGSNGSGMNTVRVLEELMNGYLAALTRQASDHKDESHQPKSIQTLLQRSVRRRWHHLARERFESVQPAIPLGEHFWSLSEDERAAMAEMVSTWPVRELISFIRSRDASEPIALVDAAYWRKGCSSLGRLRYAALLRIGQDNKGGYCLIDVKEGASAAAPRSHAANMPRDNAQRVVMGARALSPNLGDRMIATRLLDKAVVVRELMPQDLKIEADSLSRDEVVIMARYLAGVVGRAHGRQLDTAARRQWRKALSRNKSATLDAPSWLWSSVVELVALHEAAYLDHCRRSVLLEAA